MKKWAWTEYDGPTDKRSMPPAAKRAYNIWVSQRQRCTNPKSAGWRYYGARGIAVEYTAREFIGWYLYQLTVRALKQPSCGRINHAKNYSFENLELVEASENSREANLRNGKGKFVKLVAYGPSKIRLHFRCVGEAARVFGVCNLLLLDHLDGKLKSPIPQWKFRYLSPPGADGKGVCSKS